MKAIRYSLYAIVGLLVLLVLGAAIFAMTFDPNRYKGQIETLVKEIYALPESVIAKTKLVAK